MIIKKTKTGRTIEVSENEYGVLGGAMCIVSGKNKENPLGKAITEVVTMLLPLDKYFMAMHDTFHDNPPDSALSKTPKKKK